MTIMDAGPNGALLIDLFLELGAQGLGHVGNFFAVPPEWRCPCCYRTKRGMARLDKNGDLLCAIHDHHDHYCERFEVDTRKMAGRDWNFGAAVRDSLIRFPNTLICNDCNVAEPAAKKIVGAPSFFSFAPFEISYFIEIVEGRVTVNEDRVRRAYEAAKPSLGLIYERIQSITRAVDSGELEPLAMTMGLVRARIQADIVNRKEAAE
jgi:hypothetical protein